MNLLKDLIALSESADKYQIGDSSWEDDYITIEVFGKDYAENGNEDNHYSAVFYKKSSGKKPEVVCGGEEPSEQEKEDILKAAEKTLDEKDKKHLMESTLTEAIAKTTVEFQVPFAKLYRNYQDDAKVFADDLSSLCGTTIKQTELDEKLLKELGLEGRYVSVFFKGVKPTKAAMKELAQSLNRNESLNEAKAEYEDSAEFTNEYSDVHDYATKIKKVLESKRWSAWAKDTDTNYSTHCVAANKKLSDTFAKFYAAWEEFCSEIDSADE